MHKAVNPSLAAFAAVLLLTPLTATRAAEFHVAPRGNDANPGTLAAPLRTIQRAANLAQPGDVITVHAGVYRECIQPPRGGASEHKRERLSGVAGRKGRDQGVGGRQQLGEGPERRLEGDLGEFLLRPLQSLRRPDSRRLVPTQGPRASHGGRLPQRRLADRGRQTGRRVEVRGRHPALVRPGGRRPHHDLGAVPGSQPQRTTGGDQRAPQRVLPGKNRA